MNWQNIIGYVLLGTGLALIATTLIFPYRIFTTEALAPQVFPLPISEQMVESAGSLESLSEQLPGIIGEQLQGILPLEFIPQLLNLLAWSIFGGLLMLGGFFISSLGIKMLK